MFTDIKNSEKNSLIMIFILFALVFIVSTIMLFAVSRMFSFTMLIFMNIVALIGTAIVLLFAGMRFAYEKVRSGTRYEEERRSSHHIKKLLLYTLLTLLRFISISFAGGLICSFIYPAAYIITENSFFRGAFFKIPLLIIFILFLIKLFKKIGYTDTANRCHNNITAFLTSMSFLTLALPGTIYSFLYDTVLIDFLAYNPLAAFSINKGLYLDKFDPITKQFMISYEINNNFNLILTILSIIITFAAVLFITVRAYNKGKDIFKKEHPHFE